MKLVTLFYLTVFLVGCSSKPPLSSFQNVRVDLDGFAVTTTPGWYIVSGTQSGVVLNRRTTSNISEVGWALTGDAPSDQGVAKTLAWIKAEKIADANRGRMVAVSNKFTVRKMSNLTCIRYEQIARDKKVNQLLSVQGLSCVHPKRTQHYVDLNISQRYAKSTTPINQYAEAEMFFKSLKSR